MPTYIQRDETSDLSLAGATATVDLQVNTTFGGTHIIDAANGGGTETWFFVTFAGVPNSDSWESGGTHTVEVAVVLGDSVVDCDVRVGRCDSSGTILQTGSFVGVQVMDVDRVFSPVAPTWTGGEEACGNRYFVEMLFTNNGAHGSHSITIGNNTTTNEVITDITEDAGTCGGPTIAALMANYRRRHERIR